VAAQDLKSNEIIVSQEDLRSAKSAPVKASYVTINYDPLTRRLTAEETDHSRGNKKTIYIWDSRWESPIQARTKDPNGNEWLLELAHYRHETKSKIAAFKNGEPVAPKEAIQHFRPIAELLGTDLKRSLTQ
jgi:hypothetical protein